MRASPVASVDTLSLTVACAPVFAGPLRSVTVAKKRNPRFKKDGPDKDKEFLSMGFGFVEFRDASDAVQALKA